MTRSFDLRPADALAMLVRVTDYKLPVRLPDGPREQASVIESKIGHNRQTTDYSDDETTS
jgi:hypothetical protein